MFEIKEELKEYSIVYKIASNLDYIPEPVELTSTMEYILEYMDLDITKDYLEKILEKYSGYSREDVSDKVFNLIEKL